MAHHLRVLRQVPRVQGRALGSRSFTAASSLATPQQSQTRLSATAAALPGLDLPKRAPAQPSLPLTWPHKGWDDKVVLEVVPSHREPRTLSDRIAWRAIRLCRLVFPCLSRLITISLIHSPLHPQEVQHHGPVSNLDELIDGEWTSSPGCPLSPSRAARRR